jgi:hypothetical protein
VHVAVVTVADDGGRGPLAIPLDAIHGAHKWPKSGPPG